MKEIASKLIWLDRCLFSIAGPILEKELRVCSRRRRNYVLRFAFVMLLTALVAGAWLMRRAVPGFKGGAGLVFQVSRMGEVGRQVTAAIVVFQFVATQIAAAVMLSTTISEEVNRRTLAILMATPISSTQIVVGKLLSRLLQIVLLMAMSLPLLAVIRVLGGVAWDYVVSSLCVTLAAAVFVASVSLLFSTYCRQANAVVADTAFVCLLLYIGSPILAGFLRSRYNLPAVVESIAAYMSPARFMMESTAVLQSPGSTAPLSSWPLLCMVMLLCACGLLVITIHSVRRRVLRVAMHEPGFLESVKKRRATEPYSSKSPGLARHIRRVKGPPLIWRELKRPLGRTTRFRTVAGMTIICVVIVAAYATCIYLGVFGDAATHVGFVVGYMLAGLLRTATASATSVTSEKESGTLPILLTTPLHPKDITFCKIAGSSLKAWPIWSLMLLHLVLFILLRCIHPFAIFLIPPLVTGSSILISAGGVFLSSCFKRNSTSVTFALMLFLVFCVPVVCCPLPTYLASPVLIGSMIMAGTAGTEAASGALSHIRYPFLRGGNLPGVVVPVLALLTIVTLYLLVAFVCFALAGANMRRKIFGVKNE